MIAPPSYAVFVDSQGWMAVASKSDQGHEEASRAFERVVRGGWHLYTSNWTLYDALSHLKEREKSGGLAAAEHLRDLVKSSVEVVPITKKREDGATYMFWTRPDKTWSITTCANIIVIREIEIAYVLSGNQHYRQAGLTTLYK